MGDWTHLTITEMVSRGFNGQFIETDYITMPMSAVPGFPQLFFRVHGQFNFINKQTSDGIRQFVAAGSPISSIEVIDANGTVYSRMDGVNFTFNTDKTTFANDPANIFSNSFRPGETPEEANLLSGNDYVSGNTGTETLFGFAGNDDVYGGGGIDALYGGIGNDRLFGGAGADDLYGEEGNDTIIGYTTGDYIDGGADFDTWALTGVYSTGIGLSPQIDYRAVTFLNIEAIKITYGDIVLNSNQVGGASTVQTIIGGSIYRDSLVVSVVPGGTLDLANVTFTDWNNYSGEFDLITLLGSSGADLIKGSQKNDNIYGYEGANNIYGNGGDDFIRGADLSPDALFGGNGSDTLYGFGGDDTLIGDDDLAGAAGTRGDDTLFGGEGADTLAGLAGFNMIDGGGGVDTVDYRFAINTIENGISYPVRVIIDLSRAVDFNNPGSSAFTSTIDVLTPEIYSTVLRDILINVENVEGTQYTDSITGNGAENRLRGWGGNDIIKGLGGNDWLEGGEGLDSIDGGNGNDVAYGGNGNDTLLMDDYVTRLTSDGHDIAEGGDGEDLLWGFGGSDTMYGGNDNDTLVGNDFLAGETGNDSLYGGAGNDRLYLAYGGTAYLDGGTGNDTLYGWTGVDTLRGGAGNDYLYGDAGADLIQFYRADLVAGDKDIVYFVNGGDHLQFSANLNGSLYFQDLAGLSYDANNPALTTTGVYITAFLGGGLTSTITVYGTTVATLMAQIEYTL